MTKEIILDKNQKVFFVSTPLFYSNDLLHLGHCYSTLIADAITRYKKIQGFQTYFVTGLDEHGEKIYDSACKNKLSIEKFLNKISFETKQLWKDLEVEYDYFQETKSTTHQQLCLRILKILESKNLIYKQNYEGKYCIYCAEFITLTNLEKNNLCPNCQRKLKNLQEESFFWKINHLFSWLKKIYQQEKITILPKFYKLEIEKNFFKNDQLRNLAISRYKANNLIPFLNYQNFYLYVWIDALIGYLSSLQYQQNSKIFNFFWNKNVETLQIIGKEIIRFHLIYWLLLLKQLNLSLPRTILVHGWIINQNVKMSKSKNNSINPYDLIKIYGSSGLRYFLITCFQIQTDNNYSLKVINDYYNSTLVNLFGNLIARVFKMIINYFQGKITNDVVAIKTLKNNSLIAKIKTTITNYTHYMNSYDCYHANKTVLNLLRSINQLIEINKPWILKDKQKLKELLSVWFFAILVIGFLFKPFLAKKINTLFQATNIEIKNVNFFKNLNLNLLMKIEIKKYIILFKRIKLN